MTEDPKIMVVDMPDEIPLFIALDRDVKDVIDECQEYGHSIFYVLANYRAKTKTANSTSYSDKGPRIFKVIKNLLGVSVSDIDDDDIGFPDVTPGAMFTLPKIPFELIQKIDAFFRAVDRKFGTEAIIMFTYDPRQEGSDGWGIVVPSQENTGGHCEYDRLSVIDEMDDELSIVGTAHSHPGMSAFASGIDSHDQEHDDGIHITFGWKSHKPTEYHVELQFGGEPFKVENLDLVFENTPEAPSFPEVDAWVGKVKKKSQTSGGSKTKTSLVTGGSGWDSDWSKSYDGEFKPFTKPTDAPDCDEVNVVVRLLDDIEKACPYCLNLFKGLRGGDPRQRRRCWECHCYLIMPDETLDDVIEARAKLNAPTFDLDEDEANRELWLWDRTMVDQKVTTSAKKLFSPKKPAR